MKFLLIVDNCLTFHTSMAENTGHSVLFWRQKLYAQYQIFHVTNWLVNDIWCDISFLICVM